MQQTLEKILFGLIGIIVAGVGIYVFNGTHSLLLRAVLLLALFLVMYFVISRGIHSKQAGSSTSAHRAMHPLFVGIIILLGLGVAFIAGNIILVFVTGYGDF